MAHPSYQHDGNKRWKQLSPVAAPRLDTALSVNKVSRARWTPKFLLSPSSFPYLLRLPRSTLKMLTERCGTVSAGRWSVCAPPTSSEQGSTASARNSTQLLQNLQGDGCSEETNARRIPSWLICVYVCIFVCQGGKKCKRGFNIWWHLTNNYLVKKLVWIELQFPSVFCMTFSSFLSFFLWI